MRNVQKPRIGLIGTKVTRAIFFSREQRNKLNRVAGTREVATRAMIFLSGKTSEKTEFYKSRVN